MEPLNYHGSNSQVTTFSGSVGWQPSQLLAIVGSVKLVDHKADDPGDVTRTEAGLDLSPGGTVSSVGLRVAAQAGDLPENGYNDLRGFATFSMGPFDLSLDALVTAYEEKIDGEDRALRLIGSARCDISRLLRLSANLRLTRSPIYEEDVAGVLRLDYGHGVGSGVYQ